MVSTQKINKAGKERQYGGTLSERVGDIPSEGISTKTWLKWEISLLKYLGRAL